MMHRWCICPSACTSKCTFATPWSAERTWGHAMHVCLHAETVTLRITMLQSLLPEGIALRDCEL